jgi:periplasmic protein TonB
MCAQRMTHYSYPPDPEWSAEREGNRPRVSAVADERPDAPEGSAHTGPSRRPYRPPIGVPLERPSRWSIVWSVAVHVAILLAIMAPAIGVSILVPEVVGAGGEGPAGGGGGGRRGSGGSPDRVEERLQYIAPPSAPAPTPTPVPQVTPPVLPPIEPEKKKEEPVTPSLEIKIDAPKTSLDMSVTAGVGGGTGNDGSGGTGPGSGGGVGSGVGTGRGSANGPGTGGGPGTNFAPHPDFLLIPPMPVPNKVKGKKITVLFTVDERGRVQKVELANSSGDGDYDRRIKEVCSQFRFRPATRWDGTPIAYERYPMQMAL